MGRDGLLILAGLAVLFAAVFYFGFGYRVNVIEGHSMEPTLMDGSLVVTKTAKSAAVGDIIKFRYNGIPTIHRVIEITPDGYHTKGDNSALFPEFQTVRTSDLMGKEVMAFPAIGGLWPFIISQAIYLVVGMVLIFMLTLVVKPGDLVSGIRRNRKEGEREKETPTPV